MRRDKSLIILLIIGFITGFVACTHDPDEIIYPDDDTGNGAGNSDTTFTVDTTNQNPPGGISCDPDTIYFEQEILPLLVSSCGVIGCHDPGTAEEGIIMTDYANIIETGEIRPFDPDESEMFEKITHSDPDEIMPPPPKNPLTQEQINKIRKWIEQGALNNSCEDEECDTINVTYSATVLPIIQNTCLGCHSGADPSGGLKIEDHASLAALANDGRLMGTITHAQGYEPMPKNGNKLSDCKIEQILKWINDGTPNN